MQKRLAEESILFISIIKWVVLATGASALIGCVATLFLKLLAWGMATGKAHPYTFLLLPLALFLSAVLVKYLAPDAQGHGTEKVIEAIHKHGGKIKAAVVPVKRLATLVTLSIGGSAVKEGPCAQIGAGVSSIVAGLLRFDEHDRKKMVICGISAGFAAVFGPPIAGSIFGVEVLFVGTILYDVLLPSFIAGITAYQVSSALGIEYFYHPAKVLPVFSEVFFLKIMLAGVFFGLCSMLLIETLKLGEKVFARIRVWSPLKGLIGGTVLVILALVFLREYLGLGLDTVEASPTMMKSPTPKDLSRMIDSDAKRSPRMFWTANATAMPPIPRLATSPVTSTLRLSMAMRSRRLQITTLMTNPRTWRVSVLPASASTLFRRARSSKCCEAAVAQIAPCRSRMSTRAVLPKASHLGPRMTPWLPAYSEAAMSVNVFVLRRTTTRRSSRSVCVLSANRASLSRITFLTTVRTIRKVPATATEIVQAVSVFPSHTCHMISIATPSRRLYEPMAP